MGGYSGMDFASVGQQLAWWLTPSHITAPYSAFTGANGSPQGERGIDIGLPHGTPVYAILPGTVVGSGYYGGGGVVAVQYDQQHIFYYQHLDLTQANRGDQIKIGQQIGLSGGQLSGGNHPATCCSGGDHIEVGINGPWGGMWNPNNLPGNVNPMPLLTSLLTQYQGGNNPKTGGAGATGINFKTGGLAIIPGANPNASNANANATPAQLAAAAGVNTTQGTEITTGDKHCWSLPLGLPSFCVANSVYNWVTQPIRWIKMLAGTFLLIAGLLIFIIPVVAGPGLAVAGIATGQHELVAAGGAIAGGRTKTHRYKVARKAAAQRQKSSAPTPAAQPGPAPQIKVVPAKQKQQGGGGQQPQQQAASPP